MSFKVSGGCFCGNVRYTITAPAGYTHHCHCSNCRRIHGAAFVTYSMFPRSAFHWDSGAESLGAFSTSSGASRRFCKNCGTHVAGEMGAFPNVISVSTATIDDCAWPGSPTEDLRHGWIKSKAPWLDLNDDLPKHEKWYPGLAAAIKAINEGK
ncbi:MAG TPA: GFA family protein [Candidatus Binataceae bacterium]|jgi:hypothetical protein|nr:GFA family protein [Candidatus Binataceae bacterium]